MNDGNNPRISQAGVAPWWDPQSYLELAQGHLSRRDFLKLAGASLTLAAAGCRRPVEKIVPYLNKPEPIVLGQSYYYATSMPLGRHAYPLLVENREGRPIKVEGNPRHPAVKQGSSVYMQASVLALYDPDRSRQAYREDAASDWTAFVEFWRGLEPELASGGGAGLAVLSESFASPTLYRLQQEFLQRYPQAVWAAYEPVSDENIYRGIEIRAGQALAPEHHFDQAEVILSLDCDFLDLDGDRVTDVFDFAQGRMVRNPGDPMNRLYAVEGVYSLTGAMADHRLRLPGSRVGIFARRLVQEMASWDLIPEAMVGRPQGSIPEPEAKFLRAVAEDLAAHQGRSLAVAGRRQPPEVHSLATRLNQILHNIGTTVTYHEPRDVVLPDIRTLADLAGRMQAGQVQTLVILDGNPVYNMPADLDFTTLLEKVPNTIHLSLYRDETSRKCRWHINQAHFLESWGDARAGGLAGVIQPMIEPLFGGISLVEALNLLATGANTAGFDVVQATWRNLLPEESFEAAWLQVLSDGFLPDSAPPAVQPTGWGGGFPEFPPAPDQGLEAVFMADHSLWDGRFANNAWLQELPDPITKITWDNAAWISPRTAAELDLKSADIVTLRLRGREIEAPVWVQPGLAEGVVALPLGYGREAEGSIESGVGFNAYLLRTSQAPWYDTGLILEKTGRRYRFGITQEERRQHDRPLLRQGTLEDFRRHPQFAREAVEIPNLHSLWDEHDYREGPQWGMAIDLNLCTGCQACVLACVSENNIPMVGKAGVSRGREMLWLRVDGYYRGGEEQPELAFQPIPCMHCEMAPCEQVCPVAATIHDQEGLNLMVYNRCVGTRYCSNNCPYKVRRFNFLAYTRHFPETIKMRMNPEVTVRSRGVMEKCTYCLQRIMEAKHGARLENRPLRDGEFTTACAQACPTGAIVFGDVFDRNSRVRAWKEQPRNYAMLAEINTRPRTTYLARLRNGNPQLGS
jgi:molybdopterin-containing oxidoreductase family iron-sulfur binding subunit